MMSRRPWNVIKYVTDATWWKIHVPSANTGECVKEEQYITRGIFVGCVQEDVTTVELVDATDPGEHNGDTVTDVEAGLASRTNPLDDSISQANVSIN